LSAELVPSGKPAPGEAFDFVIVGSGGGSLAAAIYLRDAGRSVLILEKEALVGGTTARSGGSMWIPNNSLMARAGVEDSHDQAMRYLDATVGDAGDGPGATRDRRATYVLEASRMLDFLIAQGIRFKRLAGYPDYYDDRPGASLDGRVVVAELFDLNRLGDWADRLRPGLIPIPAPLDELYWLPMATRSWRGVKAALKLLARITAARLRGKRLVTGGAALQARLLEVAIAKGVAIRPATPVRSLVVDDGCVRGVTILVDGCEQVIASRGGVLVNAGGFAQNAEMRRKYLADETTAWTGATAGDTGEMIVEMQRLGAAVAQMDELLGCQMSIPPGFENRGEGVDMMAVSGQQDVAKPHAILVDGSGERYMNESGSYVEFCRRMRLRHVDVPSIPSWFIMDGQYERRYMICGTMPGTRARRQLLDGGFVRKASTIEELAGVLGIDADRLARTIGRFNADAGRMEDTEFRRGARAYDRWLGDPTKRTSPSLGPIEKPPFYAMPGDVGTFGGVVTDCDARVLRDDGTPIPGLYATGTSSASVMGRGYPGAGSSIGPSLTWGYVGARHAAKALGVKPADQPGA
jgi:3-oxosteroid 1-dehydrogenase